MSKITSLIPSHNNVVQSINGRKSVKDFHKISSFSSAK